MKLPGLPSGSVTAIRLRQEIFALGGRHQGEALAGALKELEAPDLTPERRALLRAVVSHLSGKPGLLAAGVAGATAAAPASWTDAAYVAVLVAAAAWVTVVVRSLLA